MKPTGADNALVYMLGERPTTDELGRREQFSDGAGRLLRKHLPPVWQESKLLRWNNVVRSATPKGRTPTSIEVACCRKSVEDDILATRPKAVIGFGNLPLEWATGRTGITMWTGRYMPMRVGDHHCWFFPVISPSYALKSFGEKSLGHRPDKFRSEIEFQFYLHLKQAFDWVDRIDDLGDPRVHSQHDALQNVDIERHCDDAAASRVLKHINAMYDGAADPCD